MEITEVKVYPAKEGGKLKAYATITFNKAFTVHGLKIIQGKKGLFVSMPSVRRKDGSFRDVAHPIISDLRKAIEESIFKELNISADASFLTDL